MELVRHLEFGNRSQRLLVAQPRGKRAPKENECRALMVSRVEERHEAGRRLAQLSVRTDKRNLGHNSTRSSPRSDSPVALQPRPLTGRHKDSRKAVNKKHKTQPLPHGLNNFGAITPAAPGR